VGIQFQQKFSLDIRNRVAETEFDARRKLTRSVKLDEYGTCWVRGGCDIGVEAC
jgi:hypothetical protein